MSDDDKQSDIQRYKNLILITQELVDSCSYCLNGKGKYTVEYTLTNESKEINIDHIMEYHKKIKEIDPNYEIPKRPMDRFSRRKIIKLIIWLAVGVTVLLFAMISGIAK
ncbi:MAG: hypothetical protein PUH99_05480 [Firmicutes bacterium]|nr:hypothetical protein [Bacillota bacterium]MDY5531732.1 hypothetical protein [Pumilibacteraceae bacterium]